MAFVQDPNQDSSNTASQQGQTGNFNQPMSVSGASAASGPGGFKGGGANSSTSNTAASGTPSSSGQFQNLQAYLGANQNYTNSGGLAGQLSSDYNKQAQNINNNITDASQNWYGQNSSKDVDPNQASQYVQNAVSDPSKFSQDPNNVSQFQGYLNAGNNYQAPGQFDPTQMYQQQVQNYQSQVGQLGTNNGRQAALQQLYGQNNPYYSQGQQGLDNLLLGAGVNAGGQNQLQQLQQNAQGYGQDLNNAYKQNVGNINNSIAKYGQDAATTQANTQGALGGAITGLNNIVLGQKQYAPSSYNLASTALNQRQLTPEMIKNTGIDPTTTLYNVDPSKYLTLGSPNNPTATLQNVITPDQQKQMDAFAQLAGSYVPTGEAGTDLSAFKGNTKAGTFTPYTFDKAGFDTALQNAASGLTRDTTNLEKGSDFYGPAGTGNAYNDLQGLQNWYNSVAPGGQPNGYAEQPTSGTAQSFANGGPSTTIAQQAQSEIQSLTNLLKTYGLNPSTGLGQTFTTINNPVGQVPVPDGQSIGDLNIPAPIHRGGALVNPNTGLPINHSG